MKSIEEKLYANAITKWPQNRVILFISNNIELKNCQPKYPEDEGKLFRIPQQITANSDTISLSQKAAQRDFPHYNTISNWRILMVVVMV